MLTDIACRALQAQKCVELFYNGFTRVVEIHTVGISADRKEIISVWQVRGRSQSGERVGWKTFRIDEIIDIKILDEKSLAPREKYNPNSSQFSEFICRIELI